LYWADLVKNDPPKIPFKYAVFMERIFRDGEAKGFLEGYQQGKEDQKKIDANLVAPQVEEIKRIVRKETLTSKVVTDLVLHCHHDIHCPAKENPNKDCNCGRDESLENYRQFLDGGKIK
jgi:hypothetical protein